MRSLRRLRVWRGRRVRSRRQLSGILTEPLHYTAFPWFPHVLTWFSQNPGELSPRVGRSPTTTWKPTDPSTQPPEKSRAASGASASTLIVLLAAVLLAR